MNLNNAITAAVGGAEVFKTAEGDRERTADLLGAQLLRTASGCFMMNSGGKPANRTEAIRWK